MVLIYRHYVSTSLLFLVVRNLVCGWRIAEIVGEICEGEGLAVQAGLEKCNDSSMYIIAINQESYIFSPWLHTLFLNSIIVLVLFEIKSLMISTILVHCDKPTILSQKSYLNFTEIS